MITHGFVFAGVGWSRNGRPSSSHDSLGESTGRGAIVAIVCVLLYDIAEAAVFRYRVDLYWKGAPSSLVKTRKVGVYREGAARSPIVTEDEGRS